MHKILIYLYIKSGKLKSIQSSMDYHLTMKIRNFILWRQASTELVLVQQFLSRIRYLFSGRCFSTKDQNVNTFNSCSPPGAPWQCHSKYFAIKLQNVQNEDLIPLLENNTGGSFSRVTVDRFLTFGRNAKIVSNDANNFIGLALSQSLPYKYDEIHRSVSLNTILETHFFAETGYILENDLRYPLPLKNKISNYPFCLENIKPKDDSFNDSVVSMLPVSFKPHTKLLCDWIHKKNMIYTIDIISYQ